MCGIAAIIPGGPGLDPAAIERMAACLDHRGPDARTTTRPKGCELGHTRLSIIDLVGGSQPMSDETGRYWIAFNGEIFNYRELRRELEPRYHFRTQSDTEVLLCACQEYGEEAPRRLNGQFAFVLWDTETRRLFAARDRLGEKPLYWAVSPRGDFVVGSELKALIASGLIEPRLDRSAIEAYLALLYVPPDQTPYENVNVLRPGHSLTWQDGKLSERAYWTPSYSSRPIDPLEAVGQVRSLVKQAVRRQMVADVPVGAFLSGGLDSSTIVALMAGLSPQPVRTFSVGFGDLIDELPFARRVAETYRTDHHEIQMDIPVGPMLERMAEIYDEPFADSSNIPTYLMSEFARRHVKVVLSGDGGDELFGGYSWYSWLLDATERPGAAEVAALRLAALGMVLANRVGLPVPDNLRALPRATHRAVLRRRYADPWDRHLAMATGRRVDRARLWGGRPPSLEAVEATYKPAPGVTGMDRVTDFDVRAYLPGDILVKVDRAAMAHGLETRAPFLDVDLVEMVLGLPASLRFREGATKYLLRAACGDLWPSSLVGRTKQGFGAPIWRWVGRPDVYALRERVLRRGGPLAALLPGAPDAGGQLGPQETWTLLCLGLWLEKRSACLSHLP